MVDEVVPLWSNAGQRYTISGGQALTGVGRRSDALSRVKQNICGRQFSR